MIEQGTLFQECAHIHTATVTMSSGPHYAKRVCTGCGIFLHWVPKPETVARQKENALILTALSKLPKLPAWERQFIRDLVTHKHISPKQQAKLLELRDIYLGREDKQHGGVDGVSVLRDRDPSN